MIHWEINLEDLLDGLPQTYWESVRRNAYLHEVNFFWDITAEEARDYRQEARDEYNPDKNIDPYWHPVMVDECVKIIKKFIND